MPERPAGIGFGARGEPVMADDSQALQGGGPDEFLFRQIVETAPDALIVVDGESRIVVVNAQVEVLFEYSRAELLGQGIDVLVPERFRAQHARHRHHYFEHSKVRPMGVGLDLYGRRKDGSEFPVEISLSPLRLQSGIWVSAAIRDITERKLVQDAWFAERERAEITLNSIGDGVISTDLDGHITYLNPIAEALTGWPVAEAVGQPLARVFRLSDCVSGQPVSAPIELPIVNNQVVASNTNWMLHSRNGEETPIEDSAAPIHDRQGAVAGAVIVFHDVSEARAVALQMSHLAQYDHLTGLPNRMLFQDRLQQAIALAQRHGNRLAVLFLDLDRFKYINDSLGHTVGDQLLHAVAARLLGCVRSSDTVGRQSGDEFVILLSEIEFPEFAALTAQKLLHALALPYPIDEHNVTVTGSIGISIYPDDSRDAGMLMQNADTAMYYAKEHGRNSHQFFKAEMNERSVERQFLENSLRQALQRKEFLLHFQPKVNLETGAVSGVEALLRWLHPVRGHIAPAQFIPVAEDSGLILQIGQWALREACHQAQLWRRSGLPPIVMAVNISAMEFRAPGFLDNVRAILRESDLPPQCLELELTESVLMRDVEATNSVLHELKAMGVRLAVDDFGTGYSSLSYLKRFPIDVLKIDQSFVRDINTDNEDATIVSAVIGMGRNLNQQVVAEGVETTEQLQFLRNHRCSEGQGYLLGRPLAALECAQFLRGLSTSLLH